MQEFEVQGHRGARGLAPENTLAGFEIALDLGVASVETDVHLTRDDVPVLCHDARIAAAEPLVRTLTLQELRGYRVAGPACSAPLAQRFAEARGIDARGVPMLAELFGFVAAYAGKMGAQAGKTAAQHEGARRLVIDIELKRVPFTPETIGDDFTGTAPATLERQVVAAIRSAGVLERARVRSFDHRCIRAVKQLEPGLPTGLLIHNTLPVDIAKLLEQAQADFYCPDYLFLDADAVGQVRAAGQRVIPYTVNEPKDWQRLRAWGVHGVTTDVPDRLLQWLAANGY